MTDRRRLGWMIGLVTVLALGGVSGPARAQVSGDGDVIPAPTHVVRPGETLYRIAVRYGLSVADLKRLNGLTSDAIRAGQRLVVEADTVSAQPPVPPTDAAAEPSTAVPRAPSADPRVEAPAPEEVAPGSAGAYGVIEPTGSMSVFEVAFRFGIDVDTLFAMNPDLGLVLGDETRLRVPERHAMRPYQVRSGDTLFRIASAQKTTVSALRAANDLRGDRISVGQTLLVPGAGAVPGPIRWPRGVEEGRVTVYPAQFEGRLMAGGDAYDPARFVVAHPTAPMGAVVLVTNPATRRSTFAEVADRMPQGTGRIAEISRAVADILGSVEQAIEVRIIDTGRR